MKVLVTGAKGFIGRNLIVALKNLGHEVFEYDKDNDFEDLYHYLKQSDFVYHLAGVCRPKDISEFKTGNVDLTRTLVEILQDCKSSAPILLTSSIQAKLYNDYGASKRDAEGIVFADQDLRGVKNFVFRLPNLFGKWAKPNHHSVIATFCYNISHNLPIVIHNEDTILTLGYIDDVVKNFVGALNGLVVKDGEFCMITKTYQASLGDIANTINLFRSGNRTTDDEFVMKLLTTYENYERE